MSDTEKSAMIKTITSQEEKRNEERRKLNGTN